MSDKKRLASDAQRAHAGDTAPPSERQAARPTPPPPFDLAEFARDTDSKLRTVAESDTTSTGPPPPFHPASVHPAALPERGTPEWLPAPLQADLVDCARRASLARMHLRVGGISRDEAVRALRAELMTIEGSARTAHSAALVTIASALGQAIEEIGGLSEDVEPRRRQVLVMEEDEAVRDKIVLAVEAHGNIARAADNFSSLAQLASVEAPEIVMVGVTANAAALPCAVVREMLKREAVPVILLAHAGGARLAAMAQAAGADACASSDMPLDGLIAELGTIFMALS